jgi:exonuclease SbcC
MLSKVLIENYQSHKETVLEFVPGTNVVIGLSDAGKSALFRAINWPITNRPLGDDFRSEWGGDTRVVLHTTEGNVIERIRSATRNEYVINDQVLKAFGTEVPEGVLAILQLDAANIQAQMDSPFLLADTPGEAARQLNKAASIDDIDVVIANLKSVYRELDNNIKHNEKELENQLDVLEQYADIPALEELVQLVEEQSKERQIILQSVSQLKSIIAQLLIVQIKLDATKNVLSLVKKQEDAQEKYDIFLSKKEEYVQLQRILQLMENTQEGLAFTECVELGIPMVQKALDEYKDYQRREQELLDLSQLVSGIHIADMTLLRTNEELELLEQQFHELSPDVCPLCGGDMRV